MEKAFRHGVEIIVWWSAPLVGWTTPILLELQQQGKDILVYLSRAETGAIRG